MCKIKVKLQDYLIFSILNFRIRFPRKSKITSIQGVKFDNTIIVQLLNMLTSKNKLSSKKILLFNF